MSRMRKFFSFFKEYLDKQTETCPSSSFISMPTELSTITIDQYVCGCHHHHVCSSTRVIQSYCWRLFTSVSDLELEVCFFLVTGSTKSTWQRVNFVQLDEIHLAALLRALGSTRERILPEKSRIRAPRYPTFHCIRIKPWTSLLSLSLLSLSLSLVRPP